MLIKSMFTPNSFRDQEQQLKDLKYLYSRDNPAVEFLEVYTLWNSSKNWQKDKWSKYFGAKLTNFQEKVLHSDFILSKMKYQLNNNFHYHIIGLNDEYKKLVITALIEMGIFHEVVHSQVGKRFQENYKSRKTLLDFLQSDIFTELCVYPHLTKLLEDTFSEDYENAYMEKALKELSEADIFNFEEAGKKYKNALLHIQEAVTSEDEESILHCKKEKLGMFLKKDFSKYEGNVTEIINLIIYDMTQEQIINFFLTLEKKNVLILVSICESILWVATSGRKIDDNKFNALANICKSFILTLVNLRVKEVLQNTFFQASDFAGLKIAYKNIGDQISKISN